MGGIEEADENFTVLTALFGFLRLTELRKARAAINLQAVIMGH